MCLERRKKISQLLSELVSHEQGFITKIYSEIDLENYITLKILPEKNATFLEAFNLMKNFASEIESFPRDLLNALLKILPKLCEIQGLNNVGLSGFFTLLN